MKAFTIPFFIFPVWYYAPASLPDYFCSTAPYKKDDITIILLCQSDISDRRWISITDTNRLSAAFENGNPTSDRTEADEVPWLH